MDALDTALDAIYASLKNNNQELDARITELKSIMQASALTSVEVDPAKLVQPNRQGRKMMQAYFKKRGVIVTFAQEKA